MPSMSRLGRVARLATLPETRHAILAAARSPALRALTRRAVHDRAALLRDLRRPGNPREIVGRAARHPVTRELASASLMFLPGRYLPLGWAASWASRKVMRRYSDPRRI
jgi:hypothetical protein